LRERPASYTFATTGHSSKRASATVPLVLTDKQIVLQELAYIKEGLATIQKKLKKYKKK